MASLREIAVKYLKSNCICQGNIMANGEPYEAAIDELTGLLKEGIAASKEWSSGDQDNLRRVKAPSPRQFDSSSPVSPTA